jgi:hypothetical protein
VLSQTDGLQLAARIIDSHIAERDRLSLSGTSRRGVISVLEVPLDCLAFGAKILLQLCENFADLIPDVVTSEYVFPEIRVFVETKIAHVTLTPFVSSRTPINRKP